jgi:CRISPR system Cascade subunit CasE
MGGNGYGTHQVLWKLFPDDEQRSFLFREEIAREQIPFLKGVKGEPVFYVVSASAPASEHPFFAVESKHYNPRLVEGDRLAFRLRANPTIARKQEGKKNSSRHDVVMDAQYHLLREVAGKSGIAATGKKSILKQQIIAAWQHISDLHIITDDLKDIIKENERYAEICTQSLHGAKLLDLTLKSHEDKQLEAWLIEKGKSHGFVLVREKRLKFQAEGYQWHALPKKGKEAGFSSVDFEGEIEVVDPELFSQVLYTGIGPAKGFGCGLMLVRRV